MRKNYLRLIKTTVLASGLFYGNFIVAQENATVIAPPAQPAPSAPAPAQLPAQTQPLNLGEIHGNFQTTGQYYITDSAINAYKVDEKWLMNGFANLIYTKGKFTAGVRYESYLNALQGYPKSPAGSYQGNGIPYRFARYKSDALDITVGNFYEQFGNGLILRSYEERGLGFDNALDGIRLKYNVTKGIYLTGFTAKQRLYMSQGPGILRGFDGEMQLNETFKSMSENPLQVTVGGSYVSRYQKDENPDLILPLNVGAYAARITTNYNNFHLNAEYAHKINDPNLTNGNIYRTGDAQIIAMSYAKKGLSLAGSVARSDNMNFRSDRTATLNDLFINYIPAINKQHTYSLLTFYPYASQPNGQFEFSTEVNTKVLRTPKYKLDVTVNYSGANNLDTTGLDHLEDTTLQGYKTNSFGPGNTTIFRDFFIELNQKFGKKIRSTVVYAYQAYNKGLIQKPGFPTIYSHIVVADVSYRLKGESSARLELQNLSTKQDHQNWGMVLFEYTFNTHLFIAALDQYNYGNEEKSKRLHYPSATVGYTKNTNRITLSYGKQREGIFCVGGICRTVPASNGVTLTVSSSF